MDGTGTTIRGGGRVVKNVAGFDLTRLMVGAFGTLGVITEVTVRLRARPTVDRTLCVAPRTADVELAAIIRRADVQPIACESIDERLAGALSLPAGCVIARYGGNAALVEAGHAGASAAGEVTEIDASVWTRLRALDPHPRRLDGDPFATSVARRLKERFDPAGVLNPGVFGANPGSVS